VSAYKIRAAADDEQGAASGLPWFAGHGWSEGPDQSRSGAPSGKYERYGRASSTARANEGRASRRCR
jgi:hypothetical protein